MAYSDRPHEHLGHNPNAPHNDPHMYNPQTDPAFSAPRSSSSVFAGLGVAVVLILGLIIGMSLIGGGTGETTAPALPASDAADAPVAPAGTAQGEAAPTAPAE